MCIKSIIQLILPIKQVNSLYISRYTNISKKCSTSLKIFCHVPHISNNKTDFGALLKLFIILLKKCKWENSKLWMNVVKRFCGSRSIWASSWKDGERFSCIRLRQGSAGYSWGTTYSLWLKGKGGDLIEKLNWLYLSVLLMTGHNFEYSGRKELLSFLVLMASDLYL